MHITSNDSDESPFDIHLAGYAVAGPEIAVTGSDTIDLADGAGSQNFGHLYLATTGASRTFTIRNAGNAQLTGLALTTAGAHVSDFDISPLGATSLAPGGTTTFSIIFHPSALGARTANLLLASNDADENPFNIDLTGSGVAVPVLTSPEIAVLQDNTNLTSGEATVSLGNCDLGTATTARTITITNSGTAALTGISVASGSSEFKTANLGATTLAPGTSTTFKLSFAPSAAGPRAATLAIASNDADENPFLITLAGTGIASPEIVVKQGSGKSLTDENAFINSGTANIGTTARTQTFTIQNSGTATLAGLTLLKNGLNPSDFTVTGLKTKSLAPGASTTFNVSFKPSKTGSRWGAVHITSNDANESSFDIILTGTGKKSGTTSSASAKTRLAKSAGKPTPPAKGTAVIHGKKYRTLSITKTGGKAVLPRDIEVSSDLVDWASGNQHTTVLLDNAKTLKVRDNTPLTQDAKRYIRLKR